MMNCKHEKNKVMKKYIYLFILVIIGNACTKDFLSEEPKGVLSPDVFFSSPDGIELATTNIAAQFANYQSSDNFITPFMGGDDLTAHPASNKLAFREVDVFSPTNSNDRLQSDWSVLYNTIRASNAVITNADKSPATQDVKDKCLGTAYFYRGYCYSLLTRIFGKVPIIDQFSTAIDYNITPSEVSDVYDLVVSDLQKAEQLLPDTQDGYPGAKPIKGTAKAMLSEIYLTMAGWPLKETDKYALAAQKAKEVMDNADTYGYELLPNFADLWTWANNYTNHEIIFANYYLNTLAGGWVGSMAAPLGDQPEEEGGWFDYYGEISFFKRFPAGPRKDATYQTTINVNGVSVPWDDPRTFQKHPYFKKYSDDVNPHDWWGSRAEQIMRYAEVLLTYAEAKAMSDGPDASAYAALNRVRNRAGLPDLTPGLSAEQFRDSVVAERGWEFAGGEMCSRWFDLIRTETLEQATALRDPSELPLTHQPTHADYWMPIPAADVSLNPNLNQ